MGKRNYRVEIDWSDFEGTHAVSPICVRSPAVQLRKFEETIKAIAPRVQHLHVMICDALDRYNLGDDATDPYAESLHRADVWMGIQLQPTQLILKDCRRLMSCMKKMKKCAH